MGVVQLGRGGLCPSHMRVHGVETSDVFIVCSVHVFGRSDSRVRIPVFVSKSARRGDADTVSRETEPRGSVMEHMYLFSQSFLLVVLVLSIELEIVFFI